MQELLKKLSSHNINIDVVAGQLKINAPKGVMTPELLNEIKTHKAELLDFIQKAVHDVVGESFRKMITDVAAGNLDFEYYPTTYGQKAGWKMYKDAPDSYVRNFTNTILIQDEHAYENTKRIIRYLTKRHDFLRTSFSYFDDELHLKIHPDLTIDVNFEDISGLSPQDQEIEGAALRREFHQQVFKLEQAPIFRIKVIKLDQQDHVVGFSTNHVVFDGWSSNVFKQEFLECHQQLLQKDTIALPPLKLQFRHYAYWKDLFFKDPVLSKHETDFWLKHFEGFDAYPFLPYDYHDPDNTASDSEGYIFQIDQSLKEKLQSVADKHDSSIFMILFTSANILLYRVTGQRDLTVGLPHVNRLYEELNNVIGEFVGPVPLRTKINLETTFAALLQEISRNILSIITRPKYPSFYLRALFGLEKYHRFSLFVQQVIQTRITEEMPKHQSLHVEKVPNARFEMGLYPQEYKDGIQILVKYKKRFYKFESIVAYMAQYREILNQIASGQDLTILSFSPAVHKH